MELKLVIFNKEVDFTLGEVKGRGLRELLEVANQDIDKIIIEGETKSYSFVRQISLFANLLISTKKPKIELKSSSFRTKEGMIVPVYE